MVAVIRGVDVYASTIIRIQLKMQPEVVEYRSDGPRWISARPGKAFDSSITHCRIKTDLLEQDSRI